MRTSFKIVAIASLLLTQATAFPQELTPEQVAKLSLEELMQIGIAAPAALTKLSLAEAPASVTIITEEDIRRTPARNIYDLIEVYVPGATWMNYEDGPQLGIRGIIANRMFKFLLRVNGRVMNNKGHYGANSELEQWDLGDIHHIEIVRGPGSVIYGPGAVAGVINIITHTAETADGLLVSTRYITKYDSKTLSLRYGLTKDKFSLFSYGSVTRTSGYGARNFMGTGDQTAGYIGEDIMPFSKPLDYFADYQDEPQVKLHLDVDFHDHWRFWARYTQQGSTWHGNEVKTRFDGKLINQGGLDGRQWTVALNYDREVRDDLTVSALISADSSDVERRRERADHANPDHPLNKEINFSETELFARGVVNWQASDRIEVAVGAEYSWDFFGAGWWDDKKEMRIGERGVIVSSWSSDAILRGSKGSANRFGTVLFVDDGWDTHTVSFFAESNIELTPRIKLLLSARGDKNTYSDWMFSPRIALVSEVRDGHYLKLIAQRSQRMGTAGQLYFLNKNGDEGETETLTGVELIYQGQINNRLSVSIANFWNDAEVVAWNQSKQSVSRVGGLQLYGVDLELKYTWQRGELGASYSYIQQLDWDLASGVPGSGISYADYSQPLDGSNSIQRGVGNGVNNWPNQAFKFYARYDINEKWAAHIDGRVLWDFQGAKDGLTGLSRAVIGSGVSRAVNAAIDRIYDVDTFDYDFRLNASLDYAVNDNFSVQVFAQNLLGSNRNKRYSYDTGSDELSPDRVRFIEEPRTFGFLMRYEF